MLELGSLQPPGSHKLKALQEVMDHGSRLLGLKGAHYHYHSCGDGAARTLLAPLSSLTLMSAGAANVYHGLATGSCSASQWQSFPWHVRHQHQDAIRLPRKQLPAEPTQCIDPRLRTIKVEHVEGQARCVALQFSSSSMGCMGDVLCASGLALRMVMPWREGLE